MQKDGKKERPLQEKLDRFCWSDHNMPKFVHKNDKEGLKKMLEESRNIHKRYGIKEQTND